MANHLPVADDALDFYQYPIRAVLTLPQVIDNLARPSVNHIARTDDAWLTWNDTGNLIVDGMFTWLFDGVNIEGKRKPGIRDLIDKELPTL